jgi:hypothetical protein
MKKVILGFFLLLSITVNADQIRPGRPGQPGRPPIPTEPGYGAINCNCTELERRVNGLQSIISYADYYEQTEIQNAVYDGQRALSDARYAPSFNEEGGICSRGNQAVDYVWTRWQPTVARLGYDRVRRCDSY